MSQAKSAHTTTAPASDISRRNALLVVSGALAAGTTVAAVAVSTMPANGAEADAELLALGRQFDAAFPDWDRLDRIACDMSHRTHELVAERAGYHPSDKEAYGPEKFARWMGELERAEAEIGLYPAERAAEAIAYRTLSPLAAAIMASKARTPAGIAVKARAMRYRACWVWRDRELDYDDEGLRDLVHAIEALAVQS